ncbi:V4R domain-containing protein [Persephonella sp.]|uniref:V4R domain-containing protein n=1 Tax=Persephonella sp. TaxID=2060922 RepID=UPI0025E15D9F|nr:V4R domain-containing protein [Persephonella sp.]
MEDILDQISKVKRDKLGTDIPILIFRVLRHYTNVYASDLLGEKASNILFINAGKALGEALGQRLYDEDINKYLENISKFVEDEKIGILKITHLDDNKLVVQLDECITCAGMDNIGKRICFFEVGLVAGLVENYLGKRVLAQETKCNANGEGTCEVTVNFG